MYYKLFIYRIACTDASLPIGYSQYPISYSLLPTAYCVMLVCRGRPMLNPLVWRGLKPRRFIALDKIPDKYTVDAQYNVYGISPSKESGSEQIHPWLNALNEYVNIAASALDPEKCSFALAAPHYHAILQHHISPLINGVCTLFHN